MATILREPIGSGALGKGIRHGGKGSIGTQLLKAIHAIAEPDPQGRIAVFSKDLRINRTHSRHRDIAQQEGVQPTVDRHADRVLRLRTVHAGTVVAPQAFVAIRVEQSELEQSLPVKGLSVHRDLPSVMQGGRNRMGESKESEQTKNQKRTGHAEHAQREAQPSQ